MTSAEKILIVDDEEVIRGLLTDILAEEGYSVLTAPNGAAALRLIEAHDDLVLLVTDIMMPGMNGIELIHEARHLRPALISIVMTGFATLETARAAVKEGAYDYVLKPFSISEVKLAVTNALERNRLSKENARLLELTELFNISETIATMRDEHQLLNFVLRAALQRVDAERGSLMVLTSDGKALEVAAGVGLPEEASRTTVDIGKGISGMVAKNVRPLLVENINESPELRGLSRHLGDPSFISVPLERKVPPEGSSITNGNEQHVIAVLNVSKKRGRRQFTESDLKILNIVANHAAAAIENVRLIHDLEATHLSTLQSMALMLEAKDTYTHGHSERVRDYALLMARQMGLSNEDQQTLRVGAAFHDIGKIGVPDSVLNKQSALSDDEWNEIKRHPVIGHGILSRVRFLGENHLALVRGHHERFDGSGYPDGASGDNLSPLVRILAVADAYDAMSSSRAYRKAMPTDRIVQEIRKGCGRQFDPEIAAIFLELVEAGSPLAEV